MSLPNGSYLDSATPIFVLNEASSSLLPCSEGTLKPNQVFVVYGNLTHADEYTQDLMRFLVVYQAHYPQPALEIQAESDAIGLGFLIEDLPHLLASMKVEAQYI